MALSPEVLAERRTGIAATDAAPILGISPWKSAAEIWLEKKKPELVTFKESPALYWGSRHEQTICEEYSKITGQNLAASPIIRNKSVPWIMCSPDRLIDGKKKGLEAKTASDRMAYEWGPAGTDVVPQQYLIQTQHCMMATGYHEWDLAVLIGGNDFRIYHLFRDKELQKIMFEQEREFYKRFIVGKETPEFDWGKAVAEMVRKKYPKHDDTELNVDENGGDELKKALLDLLDAREKQASIEKTRECCETLIKSYMKNDGLLKWEQQNIRVTWRTTKESVKIDWRAVFEEVFPLLNIDAEEKRKILERHTEKKETQRRFLFKGPKGEVEDEQ